jgi:malate/lactate dehydrogenase
MITILGAGKVGSQVAFNIIELDLDPETREAFAKSVAMVKETIKKMKESA